MNAGLAARLWGAPSKSPHFFQFLFYINFQMATPILTSDRGECRGGIPLLPDPGEDKRIIILAEIIDGILFASIYNFGRTL